MSTIPVIVEDAASPASSGHLGGGILQGEFTRMKELSVETLKTSLSNLSNSLSEMFEGLNDVGNAKLTEVQVSVEISAEGGVSLIGSAKAGVNGAITLTFSMPAK